jgi:hypothetical protein
VRFLPYAIAFVVVLYAFIDVLMTRGTDVRTLPKPLWIVVVLLIPLLGAIGWFVWGRPRASAGGGGLVPGRGRGPVAPDDDPTFLRKLDEEAWVENMRRRRAQQQGGTGAAASDAGSGERRPDADPEPGPADGPSVDGPAVDSGSGSAD